MMKICTWCKQEKQATKEFFARHSLGKFGFHPQCKECRRHRFSKQGLSPGKWQKQMESQQKRRAGNEAYLKYLRDYYKLNKANLLIKQKAYALKNKEQLSKYQAQWRTENRNHLLEEKRRWHGLNKDRLKPRRRERECQRWKTSPRYRISNMIGHHIRQSITDGKNGRHWETLVGFNLNELIAHLEKLFQPGMTWSNYGFSGWHVDHKRPIASFDFVMPEDEQFKQCWSLSNLQPLWAIDNLKKGARAND